MTDTPKELDWVKERAACTLINMFRSLEAAVSADIETAQSISGGRPVLKFASHSGKTFSVTRMFEPNLPFGESVAFICEQDAINVQWRDSKSNTPMFEATVTLDNDGNCKFRVGEQTLEQWQVRRLALEKLVFGS
jgi:hypothetical protein